MARDGFKGRVLELRLSSLDQFDERGEGWVITASAPLMTPFVKCGGEGEGDRFLCRYVTLVMPLHI